VVNDSLTEHAGDDHGPRFADARPLNGASAKACHAFTVPASDGQFDPCPVTVNPPPSTLASNGTPVPADAEEHSQFSDTYNPVAPDPPAAAYAIASLTSVVAPPSAGAVPSTATFPVTAGPHVPAVLSASDGTLDAHDVLVDGSPMMIALYPANCDFVIASHVDGVATVTDKPSADACCASTLDVPPFTDVDKISTDPDIDALAGAAATTALTAVIAAAPAATTATGASPEPNSDGTTASTPARRHRRASHGRASHGRARHRRARHRRAIGRLARPPRPAAIHARSPELLLITAPRTSQPKLTRRQRRPSPAQRRETDG